MGRIYKFLRIFAPIALCFISLLLSAPAQCAYRVLLVGAGEYPSLEGFSGGGSTALSGKSDVIAIRRMLTDRFGVPSSQIKILSQTERLTRENILKEIDAQLITPAKAGDSIIFWYGGHGMAVRIPGSKLTLQALVPPGVKVNPKGEIISTTLLLSREIRNKFSALPKKGIQDCTWFLDSCYSGLADRGSGRTREIIGEVTPLEPSRIPKIPDEDPKDWVIVSAGNSQQPVTERILPDGTVMGPLAASMIEAARDLRANSSYRDLHYLLKSIAFRQREFREPQVIGNANKIVFGKGAKEFNWTFPVTSDSKERDMWIEGLLIKQILNKELPIIPAGQLLGIQAGMVFALENSEGNTATYVVETSLASISQLRPVSTPLKVGPGTTATLSPSLTQASFKIFLQGELGSPEIFDAIERDASVNSFVKLIRDKGTADLNLEILEKERAIVISKSSEIVYRSSPLNKEKESIAELATMSLKDFRMAEFVRDMRVIGTSLYDYEVELVKVIANPKGELATSVEDSAWIPGRTVSAEDYFTIRVRARLRENNRPKYIGVTANKASVFISALYIYPNHRRVQEFPPIGGFIRELNGDVMELQERDWSPWHYLGLEGILIQQSQIPSELNRLRVFFPDSSPYAHNPGIFKIILSEKGKNSDQRPDFSALLSETQKGSQSEFIQPLGIATIIIPSTGQK